MDDSVTKYIAFAGGPLGTNEFNRFFGYLNNMEDRETITRPIQHEIRIDDTKGRNISPEEKQEEDIMFYFHGDSDLVKVVSEMELPFRYFLARAEVVEDEPFNILKQDALNIRKRFGLNHRIYPNVESLDEKLDETVRKPRRSEILRELEERRRNRRPAGEHMYLGFRHALWKAGWLGEESD